MKDRECKTTKDSVLKHYEDQWESYSEDDVNNRVANLGPVIDTIISPISIKENMKILDLGTGPAIIPIRLAQTSEVQLHIYGIDLSKNAILLGMSVLKKMDYQNIRLLLGDCSHLPFSDGTFDAVVSNATFNLLLNKENGFSEMARVTKKGGIVILGDCILRKRKCENSNDKNGKLWSQCVAGAPTEKEIHEYAKKAGLKSLDTYNLTQMVTEQVKEGLWKWPEFLEYDLKYHVFSFSK